MWRTERGQERGHAEVTWDITVHTWDKTVDPLDSVPKRHSPLIWEEIWHLIFAVRDNYFMVVNQKKIVPKWMVTSSECVKIKKRNCNRNRPLAGVTDITLIHNRRDSYCECKKWNTSAAGTSRDTERAFIQPTSMHRSSYAQTRIMNENRDRNYDKATLLLGLD